VVEENPRIVAAAEIADPELAARYIAKALCVVSQRPGECGPGKGAEPPVVVGRVVEENLRIVAAAEIADPELAARYIAKALCVETGRTNNRSPWSGVRGRQRARECCWAVSSPGKRPLSIPMP
jgi:ribosomal protein L35AE/L33A